ncbi:MAG: hypothetical protein II493_04855 [Spirochaetales bacterium]|nr:hypothetical protein [Spirochaetales bacterium]MBQ5365436.1 hypothetical protein [Spirochaetales bacterium]
MEKEAGVVALRNLKTDKVYLFYSEDIKKDCVNMRFQLDLGMHPCKSLQEDYTRTGLEVFRFDTIELTKDEGRLAALADGLDLYV